ncbi:hypothetical protein [Fimbriiglobus ruber]|uniref:Uncharacterized protein n=1 Tax=Fimbriiglobus ruber TaxID=1908690 RepID=A0A225CZH5_9BACT|nr:hypothetical protein [Fimbriiglobus ruber]OWK34662.1 hypothetical protein FRUB_10633 [Fimbriiglobus ruber]
MRWLVNYFRQCFCKHEFEREEGYCKGNFQSGVRISLLCTKCGYHRSFWKF